MAYAGYESLIIIRLRVEPAMASVIANALSLLKCVLNSQRDGDSAGSGAETRLAQKCAIVEAAAPKASSLRANTYRL